MILKILLILVLVLVAAGLIGREVLVVGQGKREGVEQKLLFRRFRRRTKGVLLLLVLATGAAFHAELAGALGLIPSEHFMLLGGLIIMVFWVLILAGRDLHESTTELVDRRQAITIETLIEIEQAVRQRQEAERGGPAPTGSARRSPPPPGGAPSASPKARDK